MIQFREGMTMKLATLKDRTRDGMLVVVSRDLTHCVSARPIAPTLQAALDDWEHAGPRLADLAHDLEIGAVPTLRFHESDAMAPLPRAYLRLDAGPTGAPLTLAAADRIAAPRAEVVAAGTASVGLAAVLGDVAKGADAVAARDSLLLLGLVADFGAVTTLSPVLVTPDECAGLWDGTAPGAPLLISRGGAQPERLDLGLAVPAGFDDLTVAAGAKRPLMAGTLVTSLPITLALTSGTKLRLEVRPQGGPSAFGAVELAVA
jgi:fumarylacetoacetate (FAA) hydrolase